MGRALQRGRDVRRGLPWSKDFRVSKYKVNGTTVSLIGDDGNTDPGKIEGEALEFKLGTLTRMS